MASGDTPSETPAPSGRPSDEALRDARKKLASPLKAERDDAEAVLVAGRDASVAHLVAALEDVASSTSSRPPGWHSPVPRAALLSGALGARDALPALYALIGSGKLDDDERPFVARALAEIVDGQDAFDDRARNAIEALARDPDRYTRAFAAQAFGALGDLRSKARVQALTHDADAWVREKSSQVMAKLAEQDATNSASQPPIDQNDFAKLVADSESAGGTLRHFLDDLGDSRRAVRDAAVNELVRAGKGAVPFLLDKLNQPQTRARIGAASALGRLQATEAAGPLLIAATAPASTPDEVELRAVALRALASCLTGTEEGLAASILPLARDRDRFVRAAALLCLGRLADRAGLRSIVMALVEDDPFVQESAAVALSEGVRESDIEIVKPLLLALQRRSGPAVTEAILIALSRVQIDEAALRVRVRHRVRAQVNGVTSSMRKAAIVLLERLYTDDDPPPLPVVDDVLKRMNDDHPEVRIVSASFVRTHLPAGMTGAIAALVRALGRNEATLGLLAIEALRRHDTNEAKAALENARAFADPVGARARELLEGFAPSSTTWLFTPKLGSTPPTNASGSTPPTNASTPPTTTPPTTNESAKRTSRVEGDRGTVVEARFDDGSGAKPQ